MSRAIPFLVLAACVPVFAATREEEAKKAAANLKNKEAKVRVSALQDLGKLGQLQRKLAAPYTTDILSALKDPDARVRAEAARALGLIDPEDKKGVIQQIAALLKDEKSQDAREGQETALGQLGATAEEADAKSLARQALLEARKKTENKREQKVIQAALLLITGKKKG